MAKRDGKTRSAAYAHLGRVSNDPTERLDLIKWQGDPIEVELDCTEFTSHCPVTQQPDFGTIVIKYVPDKCLVETKSLKLFLASFRNKRAFNEQIVDSVAQQFFDQVQPHRVCVVGSFNTRGGISVTAKSERQKSNSND